MVGGVGDEVDDVLLVPSHHSVLLSEKPKLFGRFQF